MICPNCKQETLPALFCYSCDAYLANPTMGTKASVARRIGALLLDGIAISVFFFAILFLSGVAGLSVRSVSSSEAGQIGAMFLILLLAPVAYLIFALWFLSKGKTPGKWLVGIRAADKRTGNLPGLGRMLVRETIGKLLSGCFAFLGYFWAIFDKDAQAWHDKIAGTVVIQEPVAFPAAAPTSMTVPAKPAPVQHAENLPQAANNLPPAASFRSGSPAASNNQPAPIRWIIAGVVVFGAILVATIYVSRRGTSPSPAQSPSFLQAVASPAHEVGRAGLSHRASVPTGLASYYDFSLGNSNDSKGENNGTDHSVTYGTNYGVFGQGADYPAYMGYTTVPNMQTSWSAMTISAWFYPAARGVGNFIDFRSGGVICQIPSIGLGYDSNGSFYISKETAPNYSWKQLNSTSTYTAGQWYFVVGTYRYDPGTGQGIISLFVNGLSVATPLAFADIQNSVPETTSNFHAVNGTVQPVTQYLDDLAIFSRALTPSEVSQLYAARSMK